MASTRFPGKPLAMIQGVPMVIRVYQEASKVLQQVVIASGDEEIQTVARQYGARFILTRENHISGTSRCMEAVREYALHNGKTFQAILNIQGDEPLVTPTAISSLAADIARPEIQIATLVRPETDPVSFQNPNRVKAVLNKLGYALYFSRSPIPYYRNEGSAWFSHVGMYAFKKETLDIIGQLKPGVLETAESLEQLRWLESGLSIHCCETDYNGFGVDTPEDLDLLKKSGLI